MECYTAQNVQPPLTTTLAPSDARFVPFRNESPIVSLADLGTETSGVSLSLSKLKLKELLVEVTSHGAATQARKNGQEAVAIRANKFVWG